MLGAYGSTLADLYKYEESADSMTCSQHVSRRLKNLSLELCPVASQGVAAAWMEPQVHGDPFHRA